MSLTLQIPDEITSALRIPESEQGRRLSLELACSLYAANLLSTGKAAELAGLSRLAFGEELGRRNIPRHYTESDLATDLAYAGL